MFDQANFTGKVTENADGTTTFFNPDGSVLAHGVLVPMNSAAKQMRGHSDKKRNSLKELQAMFTES
jgi:hypothetical protein